MVIKRVRIENFRNYQNLDLKTSQGFVILSGPNGAGKTNFLEAVYFGARLRRFPESDLGQLFRTGENYLRVLLEAAGAEEHKLSVFYERSEAGHKSRFKHNSQEIARQKYSGIVPVVSFLPQDLNLLTRSPGGRRDFLDDVLTAVFADYRHALSGYHRALVQRNKLWQEIAAGGPDPSEMEMWDEKLAEYGSVVASRRQEFIDYVSGNMRSAIAALSPELQSAAVVYRCSGWTDKNGFLQKLAGARPKERQLGTTVVGPHRDDFEVNLGDKPVVGYVSRGQLRSITLALKILQKNYMEGVLKEKPVMLLDDVMSEFDDERQRRLADFLRGFEQVFLTTAHLHEIESHLPKEAQKFKVREGEILKDV